MIIHKLVALALLGTAPLLAAACAPRRPAGADLDRVAEEYVRLVLAVGRHDVNYVDAYYGPPEWKEAAESGEPIAIEELTRSAAELLDQVRSAEPSDRRAFLEKQLVAVQAFLRRMAGEPMTLSQEALLLYDLDPPVHTVAEFEAARGRLEELLPGPGDLVDRVQSFRARFVIPSDRLEDVLRACLDVTRRATQEHVTLPEGETFRTELVQDQPWSAYNWYKGNFASLIEVNTDLPIELAPHLSTIAHEGYPGHHTYNALLEDRLVRGLGWREYAVYPLYSPQSLLAEGTANAGMSVIMTEDQEWDLVQGELARLAGLEGEDFATYREVLEAVRPLRYVRGEAARMLLDTGAPEAEAVEFLRRFGLMSEDRARKYLDFVRTYRSYVFNYTAGDDLVRDYIGAGSDRAERFFALLQRPATPSGLLEEIGNE